MPARRARLSRPAPKQPADASKLVGQLRALEERIVALEARLSLLGEASVAVSVVRSPTRGGRLSRLSSKRRRCPGCLLELPKGRRGPSCVWCGFYFEAVKAQAAD